MIMWTVFYSQYSLADIADRCMLGMPVMCDKHFSSDNVNTLPIIIHADEFYADYPQRILFTGNVKIRHGNGILSAKQVGLNRVNNVVEHAEELGTLTATGAVQYEDDHIILAGPSAWSNLTTKDIDFYHGVIYRMIDRQGRGVADKIKMRTANRYIILENGTFTSCMPGDNSWLVIGSKIIYDRVEQVAEVWNARFHILGVPMFYSPYLQLPIGDQRRSGFLSPNVKYGTNNGVELMLPYYWNIAPNYDATLTTHYMSKRGLRWQGELRYLIYHLGDGILELDWIPNDKEYKKNTTENGTCWLLRLQHDGLINQFWHVNIDFSKLSDVKYFNHLDSKYGSIADGYVTQKFILDYANEHWNFTLSAKHVQGLDSADYYNTNLYTVAPQLDFKYYKNDFGPIEFYLYGQVAKFTSINKHIANAIRWHLEPAFNLAFTNGWASLNAETKFLASHYQQNFFNRVSTNDENYDSNNDYKSTALQINSLNHSVNRVLPQFKLDTKLVFERPVMRKPGFTQTLEPLIQYLYVPYRNQSNIYTYDTTLLETDYLSLFRDRAYSGLDRIASQNRLASSVTTRVYDNALVERFHASCGQIYYFSRSRTSDQNNIYDCNNCIGNLLWASDAYWQINNRWILRADMQYNTQLNCISSGNGILGYRENPERLVQLNYRYATPEYIKAALHIEQLPAYQQGISQVGLTGSWPITDQWAVVGAYYYDIRALQSSNHSLSLKYKTCCWAASMCYERKIAHCNSSRNMMSVYDNRISFNVELRGLNNEHNRITSSEVLHSSMLPH